MKTKFVEKKVGPGDDPEDYQLIEVPVEKTEKKEKKDG